MHINVDFGVAVGVVYYLLEVADDFRFVLAFLAVHYSNIKTPTCVCFSMRDATSTLTKLICSNMFKLKRTEE